VLNLVIWPQTSKILFYLDFYCTLAKLIFVKATNWKKQKQYMGEICYSICSGSALEQASSEKKLYNVLTENCNL